MTGPSKIELVVERLDLGASAARAGAALLCGLERARAARFHRERDRRRYVVARARLRELLAARLGAPAAAIEFGYGRNGKPALAGEHGSSGLRFNVSHCEDVALYAFSQHAEVGADIEAVRELAEADAIAERHFTPRERSAYRALAPEARALGFFRCWTRKEAGLKALGLGLSAPPDAYEGALRSLESFVPLAGFVAAVATC